MMNSPGSALAAAQSGAEAPGVLPLLLVLLALCVIGALAAGGALLRRNRKRMPTADLSPEEPPAKGAEKPLPPEEPPAEASPAADTPAGGGLRSGRVQGQGTRPSQQDTMGVLPLPGGVLAAAADGMGGLQDGDRVSQKAVAVMLRAAAGHPAGELRLAGLVSLANEEVNAMLGKEGLYKSGSTLVTVLAEPERVRWMSVGDSRIYLLRGGGLLQLNREHNYAADLLLEAVNRQRSFEEACSHRRRASLTSFLGMGTLRQVDSGVFVPMPGDRLLLCSDGVFNTLEEEAITAVLTSCTNPKEAAALLERAILRRENPWQDNYTAIVLDYPTLTSPAPEEGPEPPEPPEQQGNAPRQESAPQSGNTLPPEASAQPENTFPPESAAQPENMPQQESAAQPGNEFPPEASPQRENADRP